MNMTTHTYLLPDSDREQYLRLPQGDVASRGNGITEAQS